MSKFNRTRKKRNHGVAILIILAVSIILGFVFDLGITKIDEYLHPVKYAEYVEKYAKEYNVPESLLYALSDLIVNEKKAPNAERTNAVFYELSADGHPVTVCLEKPDEIINLGEIII